MCMVNIVNVHSNCCSPAFFFVIRIRVLNMLLKRQKSLRLYKEAGFFCG
jgi:hypothetical protein